ncbi:MAG: M20 family metallopeptidase [Chthoniobacterales bacterium]|nr:M20 family metallopeptidase [Chthoniobacterales bacterium]
MKPRPPMPSAPELLAQLVRCPSTGGPDGHGEAGMVALLAALLEPWADDIAITEPAPGRPNLVARFDGCDRTKSYALEAHSDTVGVAGMSVDPFGAEVRGGKLHGRGACDTKGPMTSMILALLCHLRDHGRPRVTWYFVSTCDEELGGLGARHLASSGFRCNGMIVGEPTNLRPVAAHKGAVRHRITVEGVAAHSSTPERGANAIHAAAEFIVETERAVAGSGSPEPTAEPGPPTFSAGIIQGGDQVNRVPSRAVVETDLRLPPGMDVAAAERILEQSAAAVCARRSRIAILRERTQEYPPFALAPDSPFRKVIGRLTAAGWHEPARYATDAGFFASAGIPCVVFGPGDLARAHTADEWIDLDEVERATDMLAQVIATAS